MHVCTHRVYHGVFSPSYPERVSQSRLYHVVSKRISRQALVPHVASMYPLEYLNVSRSVHAPGKQPEIDLA